MSNVCHCTNQCPGCGSCCRVECGCRLRPSRYLPQTAPMPSPMPLGTAGRLYHVEEYMRVFESRALWIRSFNRLEKAVTNHIANCIDSDDLAHAHKAVMRDLGPKEAD